MGKLFALILFLCSPLLLYSCAGPAARTFIPPPDFEEPKLSGALRTEEAGWVFLRLAGPPEVIGYQHGFLAAEEIADAVSMFRQYTPQATRRDWDFYRRTAESLFWPKLTEEEQLEIEGIAAGARARGKAIDRADVTAMNGWMEIAWYHIPLLEKRDNAAPGNCSAFIATGSYTKDGGIVMGHNAWLDYAVGQRWNLILDIAPARGRRIIMDAFPGFIHSGDDFAINDAGLMVTETTITGFKGFDPAGIPEFARARRAMQYAGSIDEWVRIMKEGNNGAYANSWLIGDRKTGEIARLELGLKNAPLERTKDGYFIGSNFPADPKLCREETTFNPGDPGSCCNARKKRWEALMEERRGRIDVEAGKRFLADHVDTRTGLEAPSGRTLCGHVDLDPDGAPEWEWEPFNPGGAVQSKVADSSLAGDLAFWACFGHACGQDFRAETFLAAHPRYAWQRPFLRDLPAASWAIFRRAAREEASPVAR